MNLSIMTTNLEKVILPLNHLKVTKQIINDAVGPCRLRWKEKDILINVLSNILCNSFKMFSSNFQGSFLIVEFLPSNMNNIEYL
jgi:hypothetical protein